MNDFGKPMATPMRVPDWNQTDPKKSDYIKNRPFYEDDNGNVVKKLDEKFIPDTIARKADLKVTATIDNDVLKISSSSLSAAILNDVLTIKM